MDPVYLRTFLAILETGSFSAAGERLHCVQSNVTARIRKLEAELGAPVFERGKGGARPTALGARLVPLARDLLARMAAAKAELVNAAGGAAPLRLGALETTAASRLPQILRQLSDRAPAAAVQLITAPSAQLTRLVWEREIDAALVVGPVDPDRFQAREVFEERLVAVHPADRPGRKVLLAFPQGCSYRAAAEAWLRDSGQEVPVRDLGSLATILGCVAAGMGFAVTPESALQGHGLPLVAEPLEPRHRRSVTSLIWRLDMRPNRTLQVLMGLLGAY